MVLFPYGQHTLRISRTKWSDDGAITLSTTILAILEQTNALSFHQNTPPLFKKTTLIAVVWSYYSSLHVRLPATDQVNKKEKIKSLSATREICQRSCLWKVVTVNIHAILITLMWNNAHKLNYVILSVNIQRCNCPSTSYKNYCNSKKGEQVIKIYRRQAPGKNLNIYHTKGYFENKLQNTYILQSFSAKSHAYFRMIELKIISN